MDFRALHIVTVLFDVVFFWVDDFVVSAVAKNIECDGFAAVTAVIDFMYYLFILFRHLPSFLLLFLFLLLLFQIWNSYFLQLIKKQTLLIKFPLGIWWFFAAGPFSYIFKVFMKKTDFTILNSCLLLLFQNFPTLNWFSDLTWKSDTSHDFLE